METNQDGVGIQIVRAGIERVDEITPLVDAYRQFYERPADFTGVRRFIAERLEPAAPRFALRCEWPCARRSVRLSRRRC